MLCHYSRRDQVSSEKRETAAEAGGEERHGDTPSVTVAVKVRGGCGPLLEPPHGREPCGEGRKNIAIEDVREVIFL
jgi:hypothetical protein